MATKGMKTTAINVTCLVCSEVFKNPKCLSCCHSYCKDCLEDLQEESKIMCPNRKCKRETEVPEGGVKDLPTNFFVEHLVDEYMLKRKVGGEEEAQCDNCDKDDPVVSYCSHCSLFLCNICSESHKRDKRTVGHERRIVLFSELQAKKHMVPLRTKPKTVMCEKHNIELSFYCETCKELICMCCSTQEHSEHSHNAADQLAGKVRDELKKITAPVKEMKECLSRACNNLNEMAKEIEQFSVDLNHDVDQHYDELIDNLIKQKEEIKQQLQFTVLQKKKVVIGQLEEVQCMQEQVQSMVELKNTIERGSSQELLFARHQVINRMIEVTDKYSTVNIDPVQSATMEFLPNKVSLPQFGQIFTHIDPAASEVANIPQYAFIGQEVELVVTTKYHFGYKCSKGGSQIVVELEYRSGDVTVAQVKDNKDGSYVVNFVPEQAGKAKLFVSINGLQTRENPYTFMVHKSYLAVDQPSNIVNRKGKMGQPWGIAFGENGMWAATDWFKHRIYLYNNQDELVLKFGAHGTNVGQLNFPYGIAFDAHNRLYVADGGNHRVQKFDATGKHILQFGCRGSGEGQLNSPCSVIIHNDKLYVADCYNHRVSVFQKNSGEFCGFIGEGHLDAPYDLVVNTDNLLLVVDHDQHCVCTFTLEGEFVGKFGSKGKGVGQLKEPCSLTTDMYDSVLVADTGNNRVVVFDKDGKCVGSFASEFNFPRGITLDQNGTIYISDSSNKRIQVFSAF